MSQSKPDHWSSTAYNSSASFVPKLTTTVVSYLSPQPTDRILDIGCGDGELTAKLAQQSAFVLGLDASASFIQTARERYGSGPGDGEGAETPNCAFVLHDATDLQGCAEVRDGGAGWDKAFSNAAMHWILREPSTRGKFFGDVHAVLRRGGSFVFEMGGSGNVVEVQAAVLGALVRAGVGLERAREASPWFFPAVEQMRGMLEEVGFVVERCEVEYRPSRLDPVREDGSGGLEGWVRLMCAQHVEVVAEDKREEVIRDICDVLRSVVTRDDGSMWLGYVRLRAVAVKK
jgi:SAM-dependent methyltransferase